MMLCEMIYAILLGWLSWKDLKYLHIPVSGLIALTCLSFLEAVNKSYNIWIFLMIVFSVYVSFIILNCIARHFLKSSAIGAGDMWLISLLMPAIDTEQIPVFLLLTGGLSWGSGLYLTRGEKGQRFAFVPSISAAFIIVRIFL